MADDDERARPFLEEVLDARSVSRSRSLVGSSRSSTLGFSASVTQRAADAGVRHRTAGRTGAHCASPSNQKRLHQRRVGVVRWAVRAGDHLARTRASGSSSLPAGRSSRRSRSRRPPRGLAAGSIRPAMISSRVDLPVPFGPTTPRRSRRSSIRSTSREQPPCVARRSGDPRRGARRPGRRGGACRSATASSPARASAGARPSTSGVADAIARLRLRRAGRRAPAQPRQLGAAPGSAGPDSALASASASRRPCARGRRRSRRRAGSASPAVELEHARASPDRARAGRA